jgi:hypothetical protein
MRNILEAGFGHSNRFAVNRACRQGLDPPTDPADDVVMVVISMTQLIADTAIAKIAATDQAEALKFCQAAIYRHQIRFQSRASTKQGLNLLGGKWSMLLGEDLKNGQARLGNLEANRPQSIGGAAMVMAMVIDGHGVAQRE